MAVPSWLRLNKLATIFTSVAPTLGKTNSYSAVTVVRSSGITNGSPVVTDAAVTAADLGKAVVGQGGIVPFPAYVGTVTAGVGYRLSSTIGTQTDLNATGATGTVPLTIGGQIAPVLPPLTSGAVATALAAGQLVRVKIAKSKSDTSPGPISVTCAGSDTFESGATVAALAAPGERLTLTAETPAGGPGPVWVVEDHHFPRDTADARFAAPIHGFQEFYGLAKSNRRDLNIVLVGDSTTAIPNTWAWQLPDLLHALFPTHTIMEHRWDQTGGLAYSAGTTNYTGTGSQTIHVWNAGMPGKTFAYPMNDVRRSTILASNPDLLWFNMGHNYGNAGVLSSFEGVRTTSIAAIERMRMQAPNAAVIINSQNPRTDFVGNSEGISDVYRRICAERGYGFLDVCQAFYDDGRDLTTLIDTLHPNAAGFTVWMNLIKRSFVSRTEAQTIPRQPSSFTVAGRNFCPNGQLLMTTPPTVDQWSTTNVTVTQDTTSVPLRSKSYTVKLAKTANGASAAFKVSLPIALLAGRTITVTAPMWMDDTAYANTGQLQLRTDAGILASGFTDGSADLRDQWTYRTVSAKVPETATFVQLYVNVDPSSTSSPAYLWLDEVYVTLGQYPTDSAIVPVSPVLGVVSSVDVQVFTAAGTWNAPAGAKSVRVDVIAGGGGGGGGGAATTGALATGGGGGGGGGVTSRTLVAAALTSSVAVAVGAGGNGGAGGAAGGNGGVSSFGGYVRATGGSGGGFGNTSAAAAGGSGGAGGTGSGGTGASSSATGLVGTSASSTGSGGAAGAAGGGITTADAASAGGTGAVVNSGSGLGSGTAGTTAGGAGGAAAASAANSGVPGPGGGGGGSNTTGTGGAGGAGAIYGGGGAGGGATRTGNTAGAGGNGGAGIVIVTTECTF